MQTFDNIRLTHLIWLELKYLFSKDWIEEQIHNFNTQFSTLGSSCRPIQSNRVDYIYHPAQQLKGDKS